MAAATHGRQTVIPEYVDFPFYLSRHGQNSVTHFVHEEDVVGGSTGQTYCGRFNVTCGYPRDSLAALSAARNPCSLCLSRMSDHHLEVVAAMAAVCSQHDITLNDIKS